MLYGAQYFRPPFPVRTYWERDIAHMQAMGFNCIKLWAVWNAIEKVPGEYDFADLDSLVDLSQKYNLQVVINLIPEGAPYWTYQGDTQDLYATADGQTVAYGGPANIPTAGWPGRCMDDQVFSDMVMHFIRTTAEHFSTNASVIAFDVWNEPHLEPMYDYRSNMLCYCRHSRQAFIRYLKQKYQDLETLGLAWYRSYTAWDEVKPPTRFGTYPDMIDWRAFWLENIQLWLRRRVAACKEGAPNKRIQTHVAYSGILGNKLTGGLANELGDEFLLAREVEIFGLSSFPKWLMGEEHYYRHFLHNEMVSQASNGKMFYQVELQGGAGKPGLLGGLVPTAEDVRVWNYNTIACGGKGTVYWQYAVEPSSLESPGFGLVGFMGEDTPRSHSASQCARQLNTSDIDAAQRVCETNAVFVSRSISLLSFAAGRMEELYAKSLSGVFKAAYHRGIPIRFMHEDHLDSLLSSSIKVLYVPMPLILEPATVAVFKQFVQKGGALILEAGAGLYRANGEIDLQQQALSELMSVRHVEIQAAPENQAIDIKTTHGTVKGSLYRQLVASDDTYACEGMFEDGQCAIITHQAGKGNVIWMGSFLSLLYETTGDEETGAYLAGLLDATGYVDIERIEYQYSGQASRTSVVLRLLKSNGKKLVVANNHTDRKVTISIKFKQVPEPLSVSLDPYEGRVVQV